MHVDPLEPRRLLADVIALTLMNAQTDQPVPGFDLIDGAIIDLATHGRKLNIRAEVAPQQPASGSVRFNYDGDPNHAVESTAPYAIAGNRGSDYADWTPTLGTHTLVVTGYAGRNGTGTREDSRLLTFQVIDSHPPVPGGDALRVNAGGAAYTTAAGDLFARDTGFRGGVTPRSSFAVAGTVDDPLYFTRRFGRAFDFAAAVDNGTYTLTLHFAEPTFNRPGQRLFDVSAEGVRLLDDLDLVRAGGGAKRAVMRSFDLTVSDGQLNLAFAASVNNAIVSAIELVPQGGGGGPQVIATPAPVRVDAGAAAPSRDAIGRMFERDTGFTGGAVGQAALSVPNSPDNAILTTYRAGSSFTFSRPVANGNYALWLEFVDPTSTAAGERTFDVTAEGALVLDNLDLFTAAATPISAVGHNAVVRKFDVNVTDGSIDISFTGVVGDAIVSSIVLLPTDIPPFMQWHAGIGDYTNLALHEAVLTAWKVRSASLLRQIGTGLFLYGNDHRGHFPPSLATLAEGFYAELDTFAGPRIPTLVPRGETSRLEKRAWVAEQDDYLYTAAGKRFRDIDDSTILVYENPDTTPGDLLNVLYGDGRVGELSRSEVVAQMGGSPISPEPLPRPLDLSGDANVAASASKLRAISQALVMYSNNNRGLYPPDLGTLYPFYVASPELFLNPRGGTPPPPDAMSNDQTRAWINGSSDYISLAMGRAGGRREVLMYENPAEMADGMNILFSDGRVEFVEMRWAVELIAAARGPGTV